MEYKELFTFGTRNNRAVLQIVPGKLWVGVMKSKHVNTEFQHKNVSWLYDDLATREKHRKLHKKKGEALKDSEMSEVKQRAT